MNILKKFEICWKRYLMYILHTSQILTRPCTERQKPIWISTTFSGKSAGRAICLQLHAQSFSVRYVLIYTLMVCIGMYIPIYFCFYIFWKNSTAPSHTKEGKEDHHIPSLFGMQTMTMMDQNWFQIPTYLIFLTDVW